MKIALIILGILGSLLLAWSVLGFAIVLNPPEDPPLAPGLLDDMKWSAMREAFLGGSMLLVAVVMLRRRKAQENVLHGR